MIEQPANRINVAAVMAAELIWHIDQANHHWYRAEYGNEVLHLRMNPTFPDAPAWSLLIAEDETVDFDEFPSRWRPIEEFGWPDSADRSASAFRDE